WRHISGDGLPFKKHLSLLFLSGHLYRKCFGAPRYCGSKSNIPRMERRVVVPPQAPLRGGRYSVTAHWTGGSVCRAHPGDRGISLLSFIFGNFRRLLQSCTKGVGEGVQLRGVGESPVLPPGRL